MFAQPVTILAHRHFAAILQAVAAALVIGSTPVRAQATDTVWRRYSPDKAAIQSSEAKVWLSVICARRSGQQPPSYALDVTITDPAGYALPEHRAAFAKIARATGDSQGIDGLMVTLNADGTIGNTIVLEREVAGDSFKFRANLSLHEIKVIRAAPSFEASFMLLQSAILLRYPFSGTGSDAAIGQLGCEEAPPPVKNLRLPDFAIDDIIPEDANRIWSTIGRNRWFYKGGSLLALVGRMDDAYQVYAMGNRHLVYLVTSAGVSPRTGAKQWRVLAKAIITSEPGETEALDCDPDGSESAITFVNLHTGWARGIVARGNQLIGKRWHVKDFDQCRMDP